MDVVMQDPVQTTLYTSGFIIMILSLTIAIVGSTFTIFQVLFDRSRVTWIEVSLVLTGLTIGLVYNYGPPAFIDWYQPGQGLVTWAVMYTLWFLYSCAISD